MEKSFYNSSTFLTPEKGETSRDYEILGKKFYPKFEYFSKLSIFKIKRDAEKLVSTNNLIPNTIWNCCCKYEVSSKENIFNSSHVGQFEPSRQDFFKIKSYGLTN